MTAPVWTRYTGALSLSALLWTGLLWTGHAQAQLQPETAGLPAPDSGAIALVDPVYPAPWDQSLTALPVVAPPLVSDRVSPLAQSIKLLLQPAQPALQGVNGSDSPEKSAILRFYEARDFHPIWIDPHGLTERGQALMKRLALAEDDGLDVPSTLLALIQTGAPPTASLEVALSRAAIAYAREARGSRIDPVKLSKSMTPKLDLPDGFTVLQHLAHADKAGDALWHYNPKHAGYVALRAKLAEWRETTASLVEPPANTRMTDGKPAAPLQLNDFLTNMERWRWLPVNAGDSRIEVNIPEYKMRLYEHGTLKHTGRVVVGKTNTQTPIFSSVMDHVVINPSWGVPYSILKKEFLPKLAADPDYAERHGYQVIRKDDRIVGIRQPPGERNALGFIKFMFPNEHAVYLHDTPQRNLFARDERAFSHGCVRVDQPFALADALLGGMGFDEARLKAMIGKGEKIVTLQTRLPVHLTYFTLSVDENGHIRRFADIYGHDEKLRAALLKAPQRVLATRR